MGHIELSRSADLVVVAPATADLMAKLAARPRQRPRRARCCWPPTSRCCCAPAMNVRMWLHPATQRNLATVAADGALFVGPDAGAMACGEFGPGRMAEPPAILAAIEAAAWRRRRPLAGRHVLVTAGPDPRADRPGALHRQPLLRHAGLAPSPARSPRRGAARHLGHRPGRGAAPARRRPWSRWRPPREMLAAVEAALPADVAVFAAAVADWRVADASVSQDQEGRAGQPPALALVENPDILAHHRPAQRRPPAPGHRLRRRDRRRRRQRHRQAAAQGLPTGSSPTTSARRPASWAATENAVHPGHRRRRRALAPPQPRTRSPSASPTASPTALRMSHRRRASCACRTPTRAAAAGLCHRRRRRHGSAAPPSPQDAPPVALAPGARALVPTGLAVALPPGHEIQVRPRSGLAAHATA